MSVDWTTVQTRLGAFTVLARDGAVEQIALPGSPPPMPRGGTRGAGPSPLRVADGAANAAVLNQAAAQIREYVEGRRDAFTFPVRLEGTEFQKAVWERLRRIPVGSTATYRDVAADIGRPGAARAVGQANRRNPLPLVVPCHRVVATDGLGGYMGADADGKGVRLKREFLRLEGVGLDVERPGPDAGAPEAVDPLRTAPRRELPAT